ncbi:MAG TPA: Gfo/Idh/MocA family oxidoreductase [Terriglobales bacterium]|nr:Gfo/Idh/MocA family oxidoreductase [Terriglobales bacterium]
MPILVGLLFVGLSLVPFAPSQNAATESGAPLRVVVAGLVHGHASGFLQHYQHRPDLQIVAIAEPSQQLAAEYAARFGLEQKLLYSDLEEAIQKTHPDAVLAYTNTYDHRQVVEICARHGVHVMMEKPLAVSLDDAHAIEKAAREGKIQVLVNYETTWYRSNHAAYDRVHDHSMGAVRKVVVHDGHRGPKEIGVGPEFLSWLTDPKLNGGGALFDFGCYGADLSTWLMDGRRPDTVTALTQQIKPDVYPHVDDEATIVLTYPKAQAIIQASWNWPFDRKDMEVYGQTGTVMTVRRDDVRVRSDGDEKQLVAQPIPAPYDDSISELRAVIRQGAKPDGLSSLETNIIVTEILDAARRSAAAGITVHLSSIP